MENIARTQRPWKPELNFLSQRVEQMLQAVGLDDVDRFKLLAQFSAGKTFLFEPDDVGLGQVYEQATAVFPKGHTRFGQFE